MPSDKGKVPKTDLDFTHREAYLSTVGGLGRVLTPLIAAPVVEIAVKLPTIDNTGALSRANPSWVHLFMIPDDRYIIGFRGSGGHAYVLVDNATGKDNKDLLEKALDEKVEDSKVQADHASLGTYDTDFNITDVGYACLLSGYDPGRGELKRYLPLLVAMIAEGSRFESTRKDFARMYANDKVTVRMDRDLATSRGKSAAILNHAAEYGFDPQTLYRELRRLDELVGRLEWALSDRGKRKLERKPVVEWIAGARNQQFTSIAGSYPERDEAARILNDFKLSATNASDFLTKLRDKTVRAAVRDGAAAGRT